VPIHCSVDRNTPQASAFGGQYNWDSLDPRNRRVKDFSEILPPRPLVHLRASQAATSSPFPRRRSHVKMGEDGEALKV
jgi:hypothetical protein